MQRSPRVASLLAAILLCLAALPTTSSPAAAAGACGSYASETAPPPTIRVYRTATGAVDTVDFQTYVKNVLSREWISSWTTESIRAGALAVKNYAWYQVLHWRGYVNAAGACFDVFDSTRDQHYDPSRPTYAAMANAVDATWGTLAHKSGRVFATYYNAGAPGEACGANANGWQMFQWGTQSCGLAGEVRRPDHGHLLPGRHRIGRSTRGSSSGHAGTHPRADADANPRSDTTAEHSAIGRRPDPRSNGAANARADSRAEHDAHRAAGDANPGRRPGGPRRATAATSAEPQADRRQRG